MSLVSRILTNPTAIPAIIQERKNMPDHAVCEGTPISNVKKGKIVPTSRPKPIIRIAR